MARLLKSAYFRVSSHSKIYCYSTKPNPYVDILKTLRLWEQELKNRNQNSLCNDEFVPQTVRTVNVHKNIHSNNDAVDPSENTVQNQNTRDYDNTLSDDSVMTPENCDEIQEKFRIRNQELQKESKYFSPGYEDTGFFTGNIFHKFKNGVKTKNSKNIISLSGIFENDDNIQSSKERTTNEDLTIDESPKSKKKKSKRLKVKSTSVSENEMISSNTKDEHLLNAISTSEIKNSSTNVIQNKSSSLFLKEAENASEENESMVSNQIDYSELNVNSYKYCLKSIFSEKKVANSKNESVSSNNSQKSSLKSKDKKSLYRENLKNEVSFKHARQSLKCAIEAYINANEIDRAQQYFEYVNKRKREYLNAEIYNLIIGGWARLGRLDKVKQLFGIMTDCDISPNLMSYIGYLEAISRSKCIDVSEVADIVNKMKMKGYSPKDLLQKGVFVGNQREKIIQVLGFVQQDLNVPLYVPDNAYSFKLLEDLNDKNFEREESHFNYCFQEEDIPKISDTQMQMENLSSVKIKSVNLVLEINDKIKRSREYLNQCEKEWRTVLTDKIDDLKTPKSNQGNTPFSRKGLVYPYLSLIETEVLVNLLMLETRMLAETAEFYSPHLKLLYKELGMKVMRQYFMSLNKNNAVTEKVHFIYNKYLSYLLDPKLCAQFSPREYWEFLKSKYCEGATVDISNVFWPYTLVVYMGSVLYDIMMKTICFNPNRVQKKSDDNYIIPAFRVKYENVDLKLYKQMRTHDVFAKLYRDAKLEYLEFDVTIIPMLSPPRPWVKYDCGGLLITKVPFIRFPEHAHSAQSSYYSKVPPDQLNACFDSLNCLSLCPWIINKPILDIVTKIFQEGGSEELDIPLNPANFKLDVKLASNESDENVKSSFRKILREHEKKKAEMTSLWFDCLYKLSIANHFQNKIFWFPHNLDFRGRVYPTPPHFNHLGSDLSRSILLFAAGKPLGKKGLDWLKIHLVNLTGFKKRASHAERLEYANEILPEVLEVADNPFGENKWWMKSDKPLQTLACCKELANAVRHPNPEEYISHFPIHQDGSCNGLQHYAALGRDELGAIEVNLHPSDFPQDVYSGVAALVEKERKREAEEGLEIAKVLEGFVTRKVVKQTVMTFVYGVTPYGARLQVLKQLKDMPEFPERYQHEAASYLMKKIFLSIKEMFTATKKIQDWFTQCAEEITRVTESAVEWVTPLGLPVIQPYYKQTIVRSSKFCVSKSSDYMHYSSNYEPYEMPNVRKQKNAFAPNFIHSLDSSHMMLTSLFCHRKGITFVSVHDCYWTHAITVEAMNRICRQQFVSLHSEPILENLSSFFLKKYISLSDKDKEQKNKKINERAKMRDILSSIPEKGTFNLKKVLNSEYFFS